MRASLFAVVLIAAGAVPASAGGTVNSYTPQQLAQAKGLVSKAGRHVVAMENVQDGNFFFIAIGDGASYLVTVTSSGQVYFSNPHPLSQSVPAS
jgi:tartrate dehydratase beta subunit/fumarate hydratase class I family protein